MILSETLQAKLEEQHTELWRRNVNVSELFALCKLIHPRLSLTWYLISQDPKDKDFFYGIVDVSSLTLQSLSFSQLKSYSFEGVKWEIDGSFVPLKVKDLYRIEKK